MAFRDDNTSVIRMKRDFDSYLQDQSRSRIAANFSFSDESDSSIQGVAGDTVAISVQTLLEKDKQRKLMEGENLTAESQILQLESKVNSLETAAKRIKLEKDHEMELLLSERSREKQTVADLKAQLKYMTDKESKCQESLVECHKDMDRQRRKYEEQILTLQKEKLQLLDDLQQMQEQNWEKVSELNRDLMRNDTELKICQRELEETKIQLKLQLRRSSELTNQLKELEEFRLKMVQSEQKIKDLELQISRMEDDHKVAKAMKSQVTTYLEMEKENKKLRDENQYLRDIQENTLLLKEQNESLKNRVERFDEKTTEYTKLQVQYEELKSRLETWEGAEDSGMRVKSPSELIKRLRELQNLEAIMLSKNGELQSSLHVAENSIQKLQQQKTSLQQEMAVEKTKLQQQSDFIKRLQNKLLLVTQERDGYKNINSSYESELKADIRADAGSRRRITLLEESVQGYKKRTETLESELSRVGEELVSAKQQTKQLELRLLEQQQVQNGASSLHSDQQTILQLREKIATLEQSLETCETEKHVLENRIEQRHLQGDYDPTKTKVIHFKMNPADIAQEQRQEEMKRLTEENERLKQRVKLLEENEGKIEDLTVVVEQKLKEPGSSKDIEEIRAQLKSAELKNQRLMEAFKKKSQEIREVYYQLTGYKIDIPIDKQYRLTNMYAESPTDFLLFQQNSSGEVQMLGTDYSSSLDDFIETYLKQYDSIPAFLSKITLDLLGKQTINFG